MSNAIQAGKKKSAENLLKMAKDSVRVNVSIETLDVIDKKVIHTHRRIFLYGLHLILSRKMVRAQESTESQFIMQPWRRRKVATMEKVQILTGILLNWNKKPTAAKVSITNTVTL